MRAYWVEFKDGTAGCCEGQSAYDAGIIAAHLTNKEVDHDPEVLPYPASPLIWQFDHPKHGKCPAFCSSPSQCKGRSSCPKSYACSE